MKLRKTSLGNYFGYHNGYYVFIRKRPHGSWNVIIGRGGMWICSEGYFGTSLNTVAKAKKWAKSKCSDVVKAPCKHSRSQIAEREFYYNQKNKYSGTRIICKKCGANTFIKDKK